MSVIFENIWALLTVAGVALVVVSVVRQAKPEWGPWPLLVPLAIVGLAFGLDAAVRTDKEAINDLIADCKKAAITADIDSFMKYISPTYFDRSHPDRTALENEASRYFNRASIKKIKTQSHLLTISDTTAQSQFKFVVHFNQDSQYAAMGSLIFVGIKLSYEKLGENWFISSAEVTSVNDQPWNW